MDTTQGYIPGISSGISAIHHTTSSTPTNWSSSLSNVSCNREEDRKDFERMVELSDILSKVISDILN